MRTRLPAAVLAEGVGTGALPQPVLGLHRSKQQTSTASHYAGLPCLAGRCRHHSPSVAHPSDGGGAPVGSLSERMDLKREGRFCKSTCFVLSGSFLRSHRHGRGESREIGGSWGQRWLLLCPPPLKLPRCQKGGGSMGSEAHVVNLLGVPLSSDFLTPSFTGLDVWGVNQTCGRVAALNVFPLGDCVPRFQEASPAWHPFGCLFGNAFQGWGGAESFGLRRWI